MRNKELEKAVLAVMLGKKDEQVDEAKKPLHPNQQKLDVHEPEKDELTAKDFEMLRKGKKVAEEKMKDMEDDMDDEEDDEDEDEDKKKMKKDKMEEQVDETVIVHAPIEFDIQESYQFGDYLQAAKKLVGEEEAITLANEKFNQKDTSIFAEEFMRSDIEDKVKTHQKAGHKVSQPKYMTKSGKPYAEYVVTDKESGVRRKYIHHGNARSVENMGAAGKKDE